MPMPREKLCVKCDLHGHTVAFTGHSSRCPYKQCKCRGCKDHDKSLAIQSRERRIRKMKRRSHEWTRRKRNKEDRHIPVITKEKMKKLKENVKKRKERLNSQSSSGTAPRVPKDVICLSSDSENDLHYIDIDIEDDRQAGSSSSQKFADKRKSNPRKFFPRKLRENTPASGEETSSSCSSDELPDPEEFSNTRSTNKSTQLGYGQKGRFSNHEDLVDRNWLSTNNNKVNLKKTYIPLKVINDDAILIPTPPRFKSPLELLTPSTSTLPWPPSRNSKQPRSPFTHVEPPEPFDTLTSRDDYDSEVESVTAIIDDELCEDFLADSVYGGKQFQKNGLIEDSSDGVESADESCGVGKNGLSNDSSDQEVLVHELLDSSADVDKEYFEDVDDQLQTKNELIEIIDKDIGEASKILNMDCKLLQEEFIDDESKKVHDDDLEVNLELMCEDDVLILNDVTNNFKEGREKPSEVEIVNVTEQVQETSKLTAEEMSDTEVYSEVNLASDDAKLTVVENLNLKVIRTNIQKAKATIKKAEETLKKSKEATNPKSHPVRWDVGPSGKRRYRHNVPPVCHVAKIPVPDNLRGLVIGKHGHFIQDIRWQTGTVIEFGEVLCTVKGSSEGVEMAIGIIQHKLRRWNIWHQCPFL